MLRPWRTFAYQHHFVTWSCTRLALSRTASHKPNRRSSAITLHLNHPQLAPVLRRNRLPGAARLVEGLPGDTDLEIVM